MAVAASSPNSRGRPPSPGRKRWAKSDGGRTATSPGDGGEVALSITPSETVRPMDEHRAIVSILELLGQAGVHASPLDVVTFFVALKAKPLVIVVGPGGTGKVSLVRNAASALGSGDIFRYQEMVGHAWWSAGCSLLAQAQARFNVEKILAFAEETLLCRDSGRLRMACLAHISSAEMTLIFAELAPQIRRGWVRKIGGNILPRRAPFPMNLTLVGTLDDGPTHGWDLALFPQVAVVQWSPERPRLPIVPSAGIPAQSLGLPLRSLSVRTAHAASRKLRQIRGYPPDGLKPVIQLARSLEGSSMPAPSRIIGEVLIFVANAWSFDGVGLFDRDPEHNLMLAVDAAFASSILPHVASLLTASSDASRRSLEANLADFPRALAVSSQWL